MPQTNVFLDLDTTDPEFARLSALAGRLHALLKKPKGQTDENTAGVLDEFLGALYGLALARVQGFVDRSAGTPIERPVLEKRSDQLASGRVRLDGVWMAGFHFNNALLRLAAVYHRGLKVVTGNAATRKYVDPLLTELDPLFTTWKGHPWAHANAQRVHEEVNDLKHTAKGFFSGRNVPYAVAVEAVTELLTLLESWPDLQ